MFRTGRLLGCVLVAFVCVVAPAMADDVVLPRETAVSPVRVDEQPALQTLEWVYQTGRSAPDARPEEPWRPRWRNRRSDGEPYWRDPYPRRNDRYGYGPTDRRDRFRGLGLTDRRTSPAYDQPSYAGHRQRWRDRGGERRFSSRAWRYENGWWLPPEMQSQR